MGDICRAAAGSTCEYISYHIQDSQVREVTERRGQLACRVSAIINSYEIH